MRPTGEARIRDLNSVQRFRVVGWRQEKRQFQLSSKVLFWESWPTQRAVTSTKSVKQKLKAGLQTLQSTIPKGRYSNCLVPKRNSKP